MEHVQMRAPSRIIILLSRIVAAVILFSALSLLFGFAGSFRFSPDSSGVASFKDRALHKSVPGIKVSISVLGSGESRQSFGEDLARQNIQTIWPSIENDTE